MGCSPSKGKLFSKPECPGLQKAPSHESPQESCDTGPLKDASKGLETDEKENNLQVLAEDRFTNVVRVLPCGEAAAQKAEESEEVVKLESHQIGNEVHTEIRERKEKRKKNRNKRKSMEAKQRKSSAVRSKVDFPPQMVRAHQAAYAFLNPNISKYEALIGLLDQAAQTQSSLQPMMSALVMRFEEINQALEEIADEGELMLKEHGDYMALPSGMTGPPVMPTNVVSVNSKDLPPDLLQLMLQQSTEKMRLLGNSAQVLGDTALEEAVEYFSSLSKLLFEKLRAKQAAERRLAQVLAWVEGAAARKSNPEDLALHSEDSGIGGENESLTGSERSRQHRGSAGSGSSGSGANVRDAYDGLANNLPHLTGPNEDDEDDDEDDNDYDEEYEDDEEDRPGRKRSNSSPPDPSRPLFYMRGACAQDQQPTVRRPLTAINTTTSEHASSRRCENIVMDLQRSQKDLDQRLNKTIGIQGNKAVVPPHHRTGLRRHSLCGSVRKEALIANQSPCSLPPIPKQQSVRRLINTFSQGVDGRPGQSLANIPPFVRRSKKSEILVTVNNGNNNNNSWPDGRDDLDVESLPPPPPEVLMDNSFQSTEGISANENGQQEHPGRSLPVIAQKAGVAHRLKASLQNVEVLPNRGSVRPRLSGASSGRPVKQDTVTGAEDEEQQPENDLDSETTKADCLYQQAHKIIHLRNAATFSAKRNLAGVGGPSALQASVGQRCESVEYTDDEVSTCLPVTAPPVSRVRLPPSCPTVRHRFPSPPVFRPQTTPRPSSRPSSPRTVVRASDNNTEEIVPSVSFKDARSVFCRNESRNSQTCIPPGGSELPRPWGEVSRGRILTRGRDDATRRTQSEQRPGPSSQSELFKARGLESVTKNHRPSSPPISRGDPQSEARATATTS